MNTEGKRKVNRAIVVTEPGRAVVTELEVPVPGAGEILLETEIAGVCGSDLGLYAGTMKGYATYPRIPGHEVSARVVQTSAERPDLVIGARVTVNPYFNCGACYSCRRGLVNCCTNNQTMGLPLDGVFRQYFCMPEDRVYPAEGLTAEETALVEPFCIGYHAAKLAAPQPGERALILGAGPIGIFAMLSLKLLGCHTVTGNRSPGRLVKAREMGAAETFCYGDGSTFDEQIAALTDGDGFDIVVDAVGDPDVLNLAVRAAAHRARIVEVGISPEEARFPLSALQKKELQIFGSRNALPQEFTEVMELIRSGRAHLDPMITGRFRPEEAPVLFDKTRADKQSLKSVIDFRM